MSGSRTASHPAALPPRIVAISGISFSTLDIASLGLVRLAVPADPKDAGIWLAEPAYRNWVGIARNLAPFTGIAFLGFMAVLRNRIGLLEDRFFATVFLDLISKRPETTVFWGSRSVKKQPLRQRTALRRHAFASVAVSRRRLESFATPDRLAASRETCAVGRAMACAFITTFGVKMAACGEAPSIDDGTTSDSVDLRSGQQP